MPSIIYKMDNESLYRTARDNFRRAQRQAMLNEIGAWLRGKPVGLLVAYNGNPKSREALNAAAYFAGQWEVS